MKFEWKKLLISVLIPNAVGGLATLASGGSESYGTYIQPALAPPAVVFPIVWTLLYTLMGVALYLVWTSDSPEKEKKEGYTAFALQLLVNFLWPVVFFGMQELCSAFVVLVALWMLIIANIWFFRKSSDAAAYLLIPYLLWVTFAGYLNLSICLLNS